MDGFDFIENQEFRTSLTADYNEMQMCALSGAYKSVHVLAGSIVEALLIDYIAATSEARKKDPLKMDLAEAITICAAEGAISQRTADLSSVVRSYRNLIHPGRIVRLKEEQPTETSASVAQALVNLIIADIASKRRQAFGLTGEQLVSKIERDPACLPILKHLLADLSEMQKERFLLELVPLKCYELYKQMDGPFGDEPPALEPLTKAFRIVLDSSSPSVKRKIAGEFVRIIREADGDYVRWYGMTFFRGADIASVPEQHRSLVKEHVLNQLSPKYSFGNGRWLSGIEWYLSPEDVRAWLDPMIRVLVADTKMEFLKDDVRNYLLEAAGRTPTDLDEAIDQRLGDWIRHYGERSQPEEQETLRGLRSEIVSARLPF